ncbi:MAG: dependent epimerase/dehydratase family protein [Mycobacterium sp.]|jgi:3-oxoacyl-[acyl-carrier protein] reductase|nr:dependent epimerase/dehydratase family protein [Mycobacterium sp.]
MSLPLEGRQILVTGAATGIGAAAVEVLAAAGARIVATYDHTAPPEHLQATWLQCDVRDPSAVAATVQHTVDTSHFITGQLLAVEGGLVMPGA